VLLGAIALALIAVLSVKDQLQAQERHGSLNQRFEVERTTRQLWLDHPYTGVGLRFFKTPAYAGYQAPNNVVNEILAEAGILGLLGFLVFAVGALVGLSRIPGDLAAAALCVVAGRFVHGMFDIYWTGGTTALPWVIAGMGLAPLAFRVRREPQGVGGGVVI
jgi:O-antigen ligase